MTTKTYFLIALALIISGLIAYFQYLYKTNNVSKTDKLLVFLRFLGIFSLLLLIINPVINFKTTEIQKIPLSILLDNSKSMTELNIEKKANLLFNALKNNKELQQKYEIQPITFDSEAIINKPPTFKGNQSNVDLAAKTVSELNKSVAHPTILISDGNQTTGNDFVFSFSEKNKVYPIVLGDTLKKEDLKINQINVNKYAFLKNDFPIEVFLQYTGNKTVNTNFYIENNGTKIVTKTLSFSKSKNTQSFSVLVNASKIGIQKYKAVLQSGIVEKNKYNNIKNFAVDVIDQRKEITILSDQVHPDLGALKRAIEANAQRKVSIQNYNTNLNFEKSNLFICYQPNSASKATLEKIANKNTNILFITGNSTDYNVMNAVQKEIQFNVINKSENFAAGFNPTFNLFSQDDIGFSQFPPLENRFGNIKLSNNVVPLLNATINSIDIEQPLIAFSEAANKRTGFILGENIWKWRMENFVLKSNFTDFDVFIDKIVQFLTTNNNRSSLIVEHERFYNNGETIEIFAQTFNKNYELDENALLTISLKNIQKNYIFSRSNNGYKVSFDDLKPGKYSFVVQVQNSNKSYTGSFEVLDFDIEKQFVNIDFEKLNQLAQNQKTKVIFENETNQLVQELLSQELYKPIQKTVNKNNPIVDWVTLLIFSLLFFALEWFIRKYKGLL